MSDGRIPQGSVNECGRLVQSGFWLLALLWLLVSTAATAVVRIAGGPLANADLGPALLSLAPVAPCGLPLALACRHVWRLGNRRAAWAAGMGLGAVTTIAALFAGLLGPLAVAVAAVLLSLPVWLAAVGVGLRGQAE